MRLCLNIGAGQDLQKSDEQTQWINIDRYPYPGIHIIRDIEKQCLPFSDNSVDYILCGDVLEHLTELFFPMNEMWRVLKPGGVLKISVPFGLEETFKHPTHKRMFFQSSWSYFDGTDVAFVDMRKSEGILADFQILRNEIVEHVHNLVELAARKVMPFNFRVILPSENPALPNTDPSAIKLDVGCGHNKRSDSPGWIGVDQDSTGQADIICNIEKGMPFSDKSVDFIFTAHTLEHIDDLIGLMDEFWRVLKRDGILEIIVPYYKSADAIRHPDHKRLMHEALWNFWNPDITQDDRDSYHVKARYYCLKNTILENGLITTLRKAE